MTNRIIVGAWLVAASVLMSPANAAAKGLGDIWDVLDQMSGPGPFSGTMPVLTGKFTCWEDGVKKVRTSMLDPDFSDPCLYFEFRRLKAEPDIRYQEVTATLAGAGVTYHALKVFEVGASAGIAVFKTTVGNTDYTVKNFVISPRLVFKPLRAFVPKWRNNSRAGALQMHYRPTIRFGEIDGSDFGVPANTFSAGTEFMPKGGSWIVIDLFDLLRPQR
jgi:hypothetical protein